MMYRNTRTGSIYSRPYNQLIFDASSPRHKVSMRKANTGKLSRVRRGNLVPYKPDAGLAWPDELTDPLEGEPAADPGEPDHVAHVDPVEPAEPVVDRPELLRRMAQEGQADGLHDLHPDEVGREPAQSNVRLPPVHGDLRSLTYNVGSAIAVLLENPGSEDNLRVAILMLGDEVERLRA